MSPAKLLFGRKILSKASHVNMAAACNHTEFLNCDRERKQTEKIYAYSLGTRIKHQRGRQGSFPQTKDRKRFGFHLN